MKELDFIKRNIDRDATNRIAVGKLKRLSREIVAIEQLGVMGVQDRQWLDISADFQGSTRPMGVDEAERRIKALRPPNVRPPRLNLHLKPEHRSGNRVLRTQRLHVGYPGNPLFKADDIELWRLECAALIGPNGAGKTTFLRTVLGELPPLAGKAELGASLKIGYFAQAHDALHPELSVLDELLERKDMPLSQARNYLGRVNPAVSAELEALVNTALAYNPESRFKSATAMKDALVGVARKTGALGRMAPAVTSPMKANSIKPLWTFKCEDEVRGSPNILQGVLYIGSYDNNLYALNAADGKFQWKYPTDGGIVSRPALFEGNVYFGSEDKRLHVVSARSGKVVWTYYTEGPVRSSPRIAEGHIFVGSDDRYLHAININTGRAVWKFEMADSIRSTPFVMNDLVYAGCESGDYYAVDFRGDLKWRFHAKRAITASTVGIPQAIFFTSVDGMLYALDPRNGWILWRFRLGKPSISTPCIVDDYVFAGAADGFIYAVEVKSSKEVWRFRTEHQVNSSPVVYKDSLYCGSVDGYLYCLEYRPGRMRWKFATQGAITGTPLVYDDIVYIGATDHQVYALLA